MEIYRNTSTGTTLARSTNNPDSPAWRVIHFLDGRGRATKDQILEWCGLGAGEASVTLSTLVRKKVIMREM